MKKKRVKRNEENFNNFNFSPNEGRIAMIQMLIPLGLDAIRDALQQEVEALAGGKYERNDSNANRWGSNPGSVFLGDQKVGLRIPRLRNRKTNQEIPLQSYEALQNPSTINDAVLRRVINGISCRKYEQAVQSIPETFGISKDAISNKFVRASSKKLNDLLNRDLSKEDIAAIFMDGKLFAENEIVVALGVNIAGEKKVLGFIETSTENTLVIKEFLQGLIDRGLSTEHKILFIIDGAKGLSKGIKAIFGKDSFIQRCQWHKRENIVSYLPKMHQQSVRKKLQDAYKKPTYLGAKSALGKIRKELQLLNASAVNSLDEGLEETLTLHRLDMAQELGRSFKTTNCIENFNRQLEIYTGRVCYWKNSKQRQRWFATAALEIEPRLIKVSGHKYLQRLRDMMNAKMNKTDTKLAA